MTTSVGYFAVHVPDALRANEFYARVLGWRTENGDGAHGYHHIAGSCPAGGIVGGADRPRIEPSLLVEDASETVRLIREHGGTAGDPARSESGWSARCQDDGGTGFGIWQPAAGYAPDGSAKPGDLFYFVVPVADDMRARRFYGAVLGWRFTPGNHPGGWNIVDVDPAGGLFGRGSPGVIDVYFLVPDIQAALAAVASAGGTAGRPEPNAVGWHAACRDDQGVDFSLSSLRAS